MRAKRIDDQLLQEQIFENNSISGIPEEGELYKQLGAELSREHVRLFDLHDNTFELVKRRMREKRRFRKIIKTSFLIIAVFFVLTLAGAAIGNLAFTLKFLSGPFLLIIPFTIFWRLSSKIDSSVLSENLTIRPPHGR